MYRKLFFNKINFSKNINKKIQRCFTETKPNVKIEYVKESKKKYIFYTLATSLTFSVVLTYLYENHVLYKWNYNYDYYYNPNLKNEKKKKKVEDEPKEKNENKKRNGKNVVKNIILVRHGQYERKYKDREDLKYLTPEGKKQSEITGQKLKDILNNKKIKVIYHSNIIRAKETAQIISKYFPDAKLINDPNLDEGTPYLPNPIPRNSKFEAQKIKEDNKRINTAYETYFYKPDENDEDSYELIICHGNVIRYFLCRALQIPLFAWLRFSSYNCGITWLVLDNEGSVILREFGSVSHLPFQSVTYF